MPVPDSEFSSEKGRQWYALHVRNRFEKSVAAILRNKEIEEFLPLYQSRRQWSQRIAKIDLPLFPGYVFCRFNPAERSVPIVTTPGVMGIVGFGGTPLPVNDGEIEAIHRILDCGIATEPWKYVPSGQRVRVEHGALAGLEGFFVEAKKNYRLVVSLTLLQRSVAIQIDAASVVAVGSVRGGEVPAATLAAR